MGSAASIKPRQAPIQRVLETELRTCEVDGRVADSQNLTLLELLASGVPAILSHELDFWHIPTLYMMDRHHTGIFTWDDLCVIVGIYEAHRDELLSRGSRTASSANCSTASAGSGLTDVVRAVCVLGMLLRLGSEPTKHAAFSAWLIRMCCIATGDARTRAPGGVQQQTPSGDHSRLSIYAANLLFRLLCGGPSGSTPSSSFTGMTFEQFLRLASAASNPQPTHQTSTPSVSDSRSHQQGQSVDTRPDTTISYTVAHAIVQEYLSSLHQQALLAKLVVMDAGLTPKLVSLLAEFDQDPPRSEQTRSKVPVKTQSVPVMRPPVHGGGRPSLRRPMSSEAKTRDQATLNTSRARLSEMKQPDHQKSAQQHQSLHRHTQSASGPIGPENSIAVHRASLSLSLTLPVEALGISISSLGEDCRNDRLSQSLGHETSHTRMDSHGDTFYAGFSDSDDDDDDVYQDAAEAAANSATNTGGESKLGQAEEVPSPRVRQRDEAAM